MLETWLCADFVTIAKKELYQDIFSNPITFRNKQLHTCFIRFKTKSAHATYIIIYIYIYILSMMIHEILWLLALPTLFWYPLEIRGGGISPFGKIGGGGPSDS